MSKITTIFFDIGGVCLTNGWDETAREKSTKHFFINYEEMEKRHKPVFKKFEKGKLSLDAYLDEVVFFRRRNFSKKDFIKFMFSQSHPYNSTLQILKRLTAKKKYRLATINNESFELNEYRINKFGLYKYFNCFFSSCYLGVRKPESEIFSKVLNIVHKNPGNCLYIDDREENYNSAKNLGLNSILLDYPGNLPARLEEFNIEI